MGTGIEVSCGACGPVLVDPEMVEVHRNHRDDFALYAVLCPRCGELAVGGDRAMIDEALARGAHEFELYPTDAPPLTVDDLLDLHTRLEADAFELGPS